jgi:hypothetical protein
MSRKFLKLGPVLSCLLLLALPGCDGGGSGGSGGNGGNDGVARPEPPKRPPFMIYEAKGLKVLVDALGNRKEVKLDQKVTASRVALRLEERPGGPVDIMRLDRKVVWRLDVRKRTYRRATFGEYAAQVEGIKKLLAEQLKDKKLPSAQRRSLEIAIGRRQPKVTVKEDPEQVEILGRKCRHVRYYEDGKLRIEQWLAEDLALPCDLTEVRALSGDFSRDLLEKLRTRRGFALRLRVFGRLPTRPGVEERRVTRVEHPEKVDAKLFELPAGYTPAEDAPRRRRN